MEGRRATLPSLPPPRAADRSGTRPATWKKAGVAGGGSGAPRPLRSFGASPTTSDTVRTLSEFAGGRRRRCPTASGRRSNRSRSPKRWAFSHVFSVEHHFLDQFSVASAPEVWLAAVAQHTSKIRIGHGVRLLPFNYNNPIRAAEMAATLDMHPEDVDLGPTRRPSRCRRATSCRSRSRGRIRRSGCRARSRSLPSSPASAASASCTSRSPTRFGMDAKVRSYRDTRSRSTSCTTTS